MTTKEFVKSKIPKARAERRKTNGNKTYWLIRDGNAFMYMAEGETESKAWQNAKKKIYEFETKISEVKKEIQKL